jgi:hypothetical protein
MGRQRDRQWYADRGYAQERRCRNAPVATRGHLARDDTEHEKPALVASGESSDEGVEVLDELDRVDRYLEALSS